ncbi:unnamed protein product [Peronospora belbahrii]|uniref:Uncharacterized protein n=1 Tax=Peronospora belbahrii TaxID=622444 RepID=A0AAU9KS22_9STRA|nr:unnamed protein product [Peronospora belbahrii]CAH0513308.1 unnamed protein product [Peronospora belbahrii]
MANLEARMPIVAGKEEVNDNNANFTAITWLPNNSIPPLILVTHDESTLPLMMDSSVFGFQMVSNHWAGLSIYVSDLLCNVIERLGLDEEKAAQYPELPAAACIIMHPGTQHDGWWISEKLCKQVVTWLSQSLRRDCPAVKLFLPLTMQQATVHLTPMPFAPAK